MNEEEAAIVNDILAEGQVPEPVAPEPTPVEEPVMQEAPVPEAQYTEPAAPQMTPEQYQAMMQEQLAPIQEQLNQQNTPEPTEEEMALQQLKEQLGLTSLEQQNTELKAALDAQKAQAARQEMQNHVDNFRNGKADNAEDIVMDELNRIAQTNPQLAREYQEQPEIWEYIYQAKVGAAQPQSQPDPIVGTGNSQTAPTKSAFDRAAQGEKVSQIDFGLDLLSEARA